MVFVPRATTWTPSGEDAAGILRFQYERGSNGYVKTKYVTLTIEAENLAAARARFARIDDRHPQPLQGHGAAAHVLDGKEAAGTASRHPSPGGRRFAFEWDWLAPAAFRSRTLSPRPPSISGRPVPSASARCTAQSAFCRSPLRRSTTAFWRSLWRPRATSWWTMHIGHQPERSNQNGQAEDHRPGRHEDCGAEAGGAQRV